MKNLIKNIIKFAAKELAEAIVEEQIRQGLYMQNNRYPYFIPVTPNTNKQDIINPEIIWFDTTTSNLHSVNNDVN